MQMILCADGKSTVILGGFGDPVTKHEYNLTAQGNALAFSTTRGVFANSSIDPAIKPAKNYTASN